MNSPGFEMSLEHKMPVLINKTQMSGEHAGPPCGLTSLLPAMSCRGRAAAFARDLHTRLRSLGGAGGVADEEATWLTAAAPPHPTQPAPATPPAPAAAASPRDHDTFYDFELECESPSSPVDELDAPFSDRSPTDDRDPPFYDLDSTDVHDLKDNTKTNGFRFSTAFFDISPIQLQPAPRENGAHASGDKQLYSPITFEGCARKSSRDETDCAAPRSPLDLAPPASSSTLDSDSEFESAKSDPSEVSVFFPDDSIEQSKAQDPTSDDILEDATEAVENLSIGDTELYIEEIKSTDAPEDTLVNGFADAELNGVVDDSAVENGLIENTPVANIVAEIECLEITTSAAPDEKEVSPAPDVDETLLSAENNTEDNDLDIDDERPQRVRRCSSLKTGKTPPGTPGRKKIVRFADVLGLDLADVKTFMDEIPVIPKSAYDDLKGCCEMGTSPTLPARTPPRLGSLSLAPLFQVPRDLTETLERLNVCLESARVGDGLHINVCGSVRVRNLDFHKTVHIRYTMNRWKTYTDLQASYVSGSCDGFSDRFQFVLYVPCISSGQRLEIAVRFQCKGQQFWDNNSGVNYCFDCLALGAGGAPGVPPPLGGPLHPQMDWHPSFY